MATKALLVDFKVLAPFNINYQRAIDMLTKEYAQFVKSVPANVFAQIELIKEKATKKEFEEFAPRISKLLDEIETGQVGNYLLNMGVKKGLSALEALDVSVVAVSEMGKAAAEKFLKEKEIQDYVGKLICREKIGEPIDLGSRLNRVLDKDEVRQEDCVYFCNRLIDLKLAKAANFTTIILPSRGERLDVMMLEKPSGMIMSLEEIPNLLSLEVARTAKPKQRELTPEEMRTLRAAQEFSRGTSEVETKETASDQK